MIEQRRQDHDLTTRPRDHDRSNLTQLAFFTTELQSRTHRHRFLDVRAFHFCFVLFFTVTQCYPDHIEVRPQRVSYTDGATPYPGITSNPRVMAFVNGGDIHPKPPSCTAHVYRELCRCWTFEPDQRPTFEDMHCVFASLQASSETGVGLPASPTTVPTHG